MIIDPKLTHSVVLNSLEHFPARLRLEVQKLLGHTNLETTAIYMDLVGDEARAEVVGAW